MNYVQLEFQSSRMSQFLNVSPDDPPGQTLSSARSIDFKSSIYFANYRLSQWNAPSPTTERCLIRQQADKTPITLSFSQETSSTLIQPFRGTFPFWACARNTGFRQIRKIPHL